MAQVKKSKEDQMEAFLDAFADLANIKKACDVSGVPRRSVYNWFKDTPEFMAKFEAMSPLALGVLEDEATRRAVDGVQKPVFYKGDICGFVQEYSDTLMIVLLKARAPEKYKERTHQEVTGAGGKPISFDVANLPQIPTDKLLEYIDSLQNKKE